MADSSDISTKSVSSKHAQQRTVTIPAHRVTQVILIVVVLVIGFFGGVLYQKNHGSSSANSASATRSGYFGRGGRGGFKRDGGFGEVTAISTSSITIENERSDSSTTYSITSSTKITDNGQTVTTSSIADGDTVMVRTASETSKTATSILVNPSFGGGFGGGSSSGAMSTGSSTGSATGSTVTQ